MKARTLVLGGLAAAGGGAALVYRLREGGTRASRIVGRVVGDGYAADAPTAPAKTDRWHAVTVNRAPQEVAPDSQLPGPLAELGDRIEVQIRPAPADKGAEIAARVRGPVPSGVSAVQARLSGEDPRQSLRRALRETKMILETGEILRPDTPPTTKDTPGGKLLGVATSRSWEEGRL
jgi:hypothetical protein